MLPHGVEATDWLDLPEPILHPDAPQLVAARCGESAALLRALLDGEVYRNPLSDERTFAVWPWYPEQDDELRGPATRRAAEIGAEMPPFLDDPYESAFYLKHTGEGAFLALAEELGVRSDDLYLARVPRMHPPEEQVEYEGGRMAEHPWTQRFDLVRRAVSDLDWLSETYRHHGLQRLREVLEIYANTLSGMQSAAHRPVLAVLDDLEDEDEPAGGLCFERVLALEHGALLQVSGWLVEVDRDDIRVLAQLPGDLCFAGGRVALVSFWSEFAAFDLDALEWIEDELDLTQTFGGPLIPPSYTQPVGDEIGLGEAVSPDARYVWEEDRILRLQDGLIVAQDDVFGDRWDPPPPGPPLVAFEDLATAGQRQTVIDGITFTHRTASGFRVEDKAGLAFALHEDHWRGYLHGQLWRNDEVVASVGVSAHDGAFSKDAERFHVLTDTDLLEIEWRDEPRVVHQTPLFRIAGAIEEARGA